MDDALQNWTTSTLGEICSKPQYGWTSKASKIGKIKYVRTTDISSGKIEWEEVPYCEKLPSDIGKYRLHKNDILVSRAGSVGVSFRIEDVPSDAVFASYLIRFNALDGIPIKYIEFFLNSNLYWRSISEFTAGIAIPNVNASKLASLAVPVPPAKEQLRIVEKLDQLLPKVSSCQERLLKILRILKRFRQSVLAAACSGRLTADWREGRPCNGDIQAQLKNALSGVDSSYIEACKTAKHERSRKPPRPTCLDDYELAWSDDADIPDTWIVAPLGKVCSKITDGTHDTPSPVSTGVPYITAKHVREQRIDFKNSLFLSQEDHNEIFARCNPQCGDVLVVNIGAGTATPAVVKVNFEFSLKNVALLKPIRGLLLGDYLEFYQLLMKPKVFDEITRGGAQPFMGLDLIKTIPFSLPPFTEQQEIVRRVEALFKLADQIEARYQKAKTSMDKLTQSILAKAFRGELVPQDPNDEPASVFLERIKKQRKEVAKPKRMRESNDKKNESTKHRAASIG